LGGERDANLIELFSLALPRFHRAASRPIAFDQIDILESGFESFFDDVARRVRGKEREDG
jgi:hypothetical protein